jgi:membrane-associated phospholipid phosphatase
MISDINKIVFGNPSAQDRLIMSCQNYLDKLIPSLKTFSNPKNNSEVTISELNQLTHYLSLGKVVEHNLYDKNLIQYIKDFYITEGAPPELIDSLATSVQTDVVPLITKLKYHFNRPRPAQLAYYYDMQLYPDFSYFTNNPSYPSGHTTLTAITCEVFGNQFPETYKKISSLMPRVAESRLCLGVHYPSDNNMAHIVAKRVITNPEFKRKHKL